MKPSLCLAIPLAFCASAPAAAADFSVGTPVGAGYCTCATLQCAFDAAQASPDPVNTVRISRSLAYADEDATLTVGSGRTLRVQGGYATCEQAVRDANRTVISGAGGEAAPVLSVQADGELILERLEISGGDNVHTASSPGYGGGIAFAGTGTLALVDSVVRDNRADVGGGIFARGRQGSDDQGDNGLLKLTQNVQILSNRAVYSGGGLALNGADLQMPGDDILIAFNEAQQGWGGGIYLSHQEDRDVFADVLSPGYAGLPPVYGNEAVRGGGIALAGTACHDELFDQSGECKLQVRVGARQGSAEAGAISGNSASEVGGGVYVLPWTGGITDGWVPSTLILQDGARVDDNLAPLGAAVYLDYDSGLDGTRGGELRADDAHFTGNAGRTTGGTPTAGAIVHAADDAVVLVHRAQFRDNDGGPVLRADSTAAAELDHVLIVDNISRGSVIQSSNDAPLLLQDATVAGNAFDGGAALSISDDLELRRVVLHQPGKPVLAQSGGNRRVEYVSAHEAASLGNPADGKTMVPPDPRFFDPDAGDYRLHAASPAVDFAPEDAPYVSGAPNVDLEGNLRETDLTVVGDRFGQRDLGAFERTGLQPLVRNGGFVSGLRLWQANGGVYVADSAQADGSGGVYVNAIAPAGGRVVGPQQCVPLPGRGKYALSGWGKEPSTSTANADYPRLEWRLFGNAQCTGTPLSEGGIALPSGNAWAQSASTEFSVSNLQWSYNTAVSITLVAVDNNVSGTNAVDAYFDGIVLEHVGEGNVAPAIAAALVNRSDAEGETVLQATAFAFSDGDGDALRYSATGLPPGLSIDAFDGEIAGTLDYSAAGAHSVLVTARDPFGASISQAFAWTVTDTPLDGSLFGDGFEGAP